MTPSAKPEPRQHNRRWEEADVTRALALASDGLTGTEIGEKVGRTKSSVIALFARLRDDGDERMRAAEINREIVRATMPRRAGVRNHSPEAEARRAAERARWARRNEASRRAVAGIAGDVAGAASAIRSTLPDAPCFRCGARGWCDHRPADLHAPTIITKGEATNA